MQIKPIREKNYVSHNQRNWRGKCLNVGYSLSILDHILGIQDLPYVLALEQREGRR